MSILFTDGFDLEATGDVVLKWGATNSSVSAGGTSSFSIATGRFSPGNALHLGQSISTNMSSTTEAIHTFPSRSTIIFGVAMKPSQYASGTVTNNANPQLVIFQDSSSGNQITLTLDPSTQCLQVFRGSRTGTLLCTGSTTVPLNVWTYVEIKVVVSSTVGSITLRQAGSVTATFSGNTQATGNANIAAMRLGPGGTSVGNPGGSSNSTDYDDVVLMDANGTLNNDFLGEVRVIGLLPTATGVGGTTFTKVGTSPTNWQSVANATQDGDTTYVASPTTGQTETYKYASLPNSASQVLAVVATPVARKDDSGARVLGTHVRSNSTEADASTTSVLSTSYVTFEHVMETNPTTSAPWTVTDVNNAEYGPKISA
jgi:hypothetical protein